MSGYICSMNYFELFGLTISLKVDTGSLAKKYFELQREFHPDFFTQSDETEQQDALEKSAEINKALKILKNPDATIQYVLQIKNLLTENEKYELPPEFLMDMMELNEKLVEQDSDSFSKEVAQLEESLQSEVKDIIEQYDNESISEESLQKLKEFYFKKKYLQRILDRIAD
jgi:molecular chaperone HscB